MRKLYYFFVSAGEVIFVWSLIFILSVTLQSVVIKGKVDYGGRCYSEFNDEFIISFDYNGIVLKNGYLECNTYYLVYETDLNENDNIIFLASIAKLFKDNDIDINIHVMLINKEYQIIATIVDYQVNYVKSILKKE